MSSPQPAAGEGRRLARCLHFCRCGGAAPEHRVERALGGDHRLAERDCLAPHRLDLHGKQRALRL